MSTIGERIKGLRLSKKVTQKEIADAIGVSSVSVQRFEYGSVRPSLDTLIALANYFDVSLDYLCGRDEFLAKQHENCHSDQNKGAGNLDGAEDIHEQP